MAARKNSYRVLVAGGGSNVCDSLSALLPKNEYEFSYHAENAAQTRRAILTIQVDLIIILAPLKDEFGTQLAIDLADQNYGVLLLVDTDMYDQSCYTVEEYGVMTLAKPISRKGFYSAVRMLSAFRSKMLLMEARQKKLQKKMDDMRISNRAKWILIDRRRMTEDEAHHYIEHKAMNLRISTREAAESILQEYNI